MANEGRQLLGAVVVAFAIQIVGDAFIYPEEEEGVGFVEGSIGATIIQVLPALIIVLALMNIF